MNKGDPHRERCFYWILTLWVCSMVIAVPALAGAVYYTLFLRRMEGLYALIPAVFAAILYLLLKRFKPES